MRNSIFLTLIVLLLFACHNKHNVEIKGEIKDGAKQKVYLEQINVDQVVRVDSAKTDRKGRFTFKTMVKMPYFYQVKIGDRETVTILAEPDSKIELTGTLEGLKDNYWVEGSEGSLWIKLLNFHLNKSQSVLDSLRKSYKALPAGELYNAERQKLSAAWDSVVVKQQNFSREFILKHAVSLASYYALYQKLDQYYVLLPDRDLQSFKIVASALQAMYPDSPYTKAIMNHLKQISKGIQNQRLLELMASTESTLPNISLPNINGDTISLASLKGKYIILDFNVLGTQDGRAYCNELKRIYDKYRSKGVEIYQVCLSKNILLWRKYVKDYGINWICVCDTDELGSRVVRSWNIKEVPANFIINKKFEIVGKNLNGQRLDDRLNDIIK